MSQRTIIVLLLVAAVSAGTLWFTFNQPKAEKVEIEHALSAQNNHASSDLTEAKTFKKKAVLAADDDGLTEFNPFESDAFKEQLKQVADIYAENIKYPITSQPIYNADEARDYKEFEQSEVDLPFPGDDDDQNPIRISAATNTFQYFQGDTVIVRVQISGAPQETFIDVKGVLSGSNGDLPIEGVFHPNDESLTQFTAVFDTKLAPSSLLTHEMLVKLNVSVGDRPLFTTVAFRYSDASAQIIGVQQVRTEGPNLVIPLQVNVFQSGYYFVNGILEDAQTGRPLIQLQAEKRFLQGNGIINLSAHITALRRQASEGPYVLRSLRSHRGAEVGERFDVPVSTSSPRYSIQGFPFSAYDDEEYENEDSEDVLEFLDGLGGDGDDALD